MSISRRDVILGTALLAGGAVAKKAKAAPPAPDQPHAHGPAAAPASETHAPSAARLAYTPVGTPNGATLPWKMGNGAKEVHLIAEPVKHEFAPGMIINCWCYNPRSPGPTIE